MTDRLAQTERALINADKAGDVEAARLLAQEVVRLRGPSSQKGSFADSLMQGVSFGLSDEIGAAGAGTGAAIKSAASDIASGKVPSNIGGAFSEAYERRLGQHRDGLKNYRESNPVFSIAGEILGGAVTGGQLAKGGLTLMNAAKPTVGNMALRGAGEGAAYGAAYGAGTGEGAQDRLVKALYGGVLGGAGGAAVGAAGGALAARNAPKSPSVSDLSKQANAAYKAAEDAGVVVRPDSFMTAVDDIANDALKRGIDKTIHPKASAALERLAEAKGQPQTLQNLDTLRRVIKGAAASNERDERRIARFMIEKLDDYIGGLGPGDVLAGDAPKAVGALQEARGLWSRVRKGEVVDDLVMRARNRSSQFSGSGYENALRTEFRNLVQNEKRLRVFSKPEQAALRKVAMGGPVENVLRMLGKFAPTGIVSTGISVGGGQMIGGPVGAVVLPALGFGARQAATAATARNARLAGELMRSGAPPAVKQLSAAQQQLLRALMTAGAVEAPRAAPVGMAR